MDNPVWHWLVREPISAWQAAERFGAPSARVVGPGWSFDRFGCSTTPLPDGRVLRIAGEHEDHYDPDFYIYNDVVVRHPDGEIEIFGYPPDVFPATDFHSATLVDGSVWLIGNLGYPDQRKHGSVQVCRLSLDTLSIETMTTRGESPGWLHGHTASLLDGGILVQRGTVDDGHGLRDNIDDWRLNLSELRWTRLTERPFQSWAVRREDGEPLLYWEMDQLAWELEHQRGGGIDYARTLGPRLEHFSLETFRTLFIPPIAHTLIEPDLDDTCEADNTRYDTAQICVGDALVRYHDERAALSLKIEGALPDAAIHSLVQDLVQKQSALQGSRCLAQRTD